MAIVATNTLKHKLRILLDRLPVKNRQATMTTEKKLEKRCNETVKKADGIPIKLLPFQFAGLPDRLYLLPIGKAYFVEFKSEGKLQSPIQMFVAKKLAAIGFPVIVIDTDKKLIEFLTKIISTK